LGKFGTFGLGRKSSILKFPIFVRHKNWQYCPICVAQLHVWSIPKGKGYSGKCGKLNNSDSVVKVRFHKSFQWLTIQKEQVRKLVIHGTFSEITFCEARICLFLRALRRAAKRLVYIYDHESPIGIYGKLGKLGKFGLSSKSSI
jgi:hypothetical protein